MCGIFGVIANNDNVKDQIFDGLRRLEYRGIVQMNPTWRVNIMS